MNNKEIYDKIYKEIPAYNSYSSSRHDKKDEPISAYLSCLEGTLLDIGCGSGHNLKMALDMGVEAFGVEISKECCNKFLSDVPHKCSDIVTFCKSKKRFDNVLCNDMLEHISIEDIDETLKCISSISLIALFGIANHSDRMLDIELHPIQENKEWWMKKLGEYYSSVCFMEELFDGAFFFIKCKK